MYKKFVEVAGLPSWPMYTVQLNLHPKEASLIKGEGKKKVCFNRAATWYLSPAVV